MRYLFLCLALLTIPIMSHDASAADNVCAISPDSGGVSEVAAPSEMVTDVDQVIAERPAVETGDDVIDVTSAPDIATSGHELNVMSDRHDWMLEHVWSMAPSPGDGTDVADLDPRKVYLEHEPDHVLMEYQSSERFGVMHARIFVEGGAIGERHLC